ncbi:MAG: hypothetical protein CL570_04890 [Alphaproteobacteria bacterium]|nr:hypothetical protein [Alphaproteobacteria bacterium]|tara:strand:- start:4314 stop:6353 length:2040 start_codon:yes stop_codon:yes gene_type:complete
MVVEPQSQTRVEEKTHSHNLKKFAEAFSEAYGKKSDAEKDFLTYLQAYLDNSDQVAPSAAKRLLNSLGQAKVYSTNGAQVVSLAENGMKSVEDLNDPDFDKARFSRLYGRSQITQYDAFDGIYGMEEPLNKVIDFIKASSQGLEEKNQILCLVGPPASGKTTLVERLKEHMETQPFDYIAGSPSHEHPLAILNTSIGKQLLKQHGINIPGLDEYKPSSWLEEKLKEKKGKLQDFKIVSAYPSQRHKLALAKVEAGNNQTAVQQLESALTHGNNGILDLSEVMKWPENEIEALQKLLNVTQSHEYQSKDGTAPFNGVIIVQANWEEWNKFCNNDKFKALRDRMCMVKMPYVLRSDAEVNVYQDAIANSDLSKAPLAPHTLTMLADFVVASRMSRAKGQRFDMLQKVHAYNGDEVDRVEKITGDESELVDALKYYKDLAQTKEGADPEGFSGISTRDSLKLLGRIFNANAVAPEADPLIVLETLEAFTSEQKNTNLKNQWHNLITQLKDEYRKKLEHDLKTACVPGYEAVGQEEYDKYVNYLNHLEERPGEMYKDGETTKSPEELEKELRDIESHIQIMQGKKPDEWKAFRGTILQNELRYRSVNSQAHKGWKTVPALFQAIESKILMTDKEMESIIRQGADATNEGIARHKKFVEEMLLKGYSQRQVHKTARFFLGNEPK